MLENGFYVGEVGHFSSWNVDTKTDPIYVRGKVFAEVNGENIEVSYLQVYVNIEGIQQVGGYLDDGGEFEFYNFPPGRTFTMTILDACGDILWEEELGPYQENTDLETIVVQSTNSNFVTISGSGVDCKGNSLVEGYAWFVMNGISSYFPLEESGTFEFVVNVCGTIEGEIGLTNLLNDTYSSSQTIDLTTSSVIIEEPLIAKTLGADAITITGSVIDCAGNNTSHGYLWFTINDVTSTYQLNEDGSFEFVVNVCDETEGIIRVISYSNGYSVSKTINLILPSIYIEESFMLRNIATNPVTITGIGTDCNGNSIENGYVRFTLYDSHTYPLNEDGSFEFVVNVCDETEGVISLTDLTNNKSSSTQSVDIISSSSLEVNTITACDEVESFLEVETEGENSDYYPISKAYLHPNGINIISSEDISDLNGVETEVVRIGLPQGVEIGIHNNIDFHSGSGLGANNVWIDIQTSFSETIVVEITEFGGSSGDIIRGTFYKEEINPETGEITYPISGSFKAIVQ